MTDTLSENPGVSRRLALGLGAAAFASLPAAAAPLDPNTPSGMRLMVRKLQFRTDSGMVFWWMRGRYYGQTDAVLVPFYGLNWGAIQRVTQRADGGFDVKEIEISFRTDLETGKRLTSFRNPITGEVVPVVFSPLGPSIVNYDKNNLPQLPSEIAGGSHADSKSFPQEPMVIGDQVLFQTRSSTRVTTPGVADRLFNDITTVSGPLKSASDPAVTSAKAVLQSSDVTSWQRWLNMDGRPGAMTLRALGGKEMRFADMPADFLAMLREAAPDIAADPVGALDRPPATFKN